MPPKVTPPPKPDQGEPPSPLPVSWVPSSASAAFSKRSVAFVLLLVIVLQLPLNRIVKFVKSLTISYSTRFAPSVPPSIKTFLSSSTVKLTLPLR